MKIVCIDNYDRELYDDTLVCENVNKHYGNLLVNYLNSREPKDTVDYYKLVENDYKLYKFEI